MLAYFGLGASDGNRIVTSTRRNVLVIAAAAVCLAAWGCGKQRDFGLSQTSAESESADSDVDEDATPEERKYIEAGKPFVVALAAGRYDEAYDHLSSHARSRMSVNQFAPPEDEAAQLKNEAEPLRDVSREKFVELMGQVEERYGKPHKVGDLYVESTDPAVLSGKGDQIDVMFAIGTMPASIPAEIRRASLRAQVMTKYKPEEAKKVAAEYGITVEELERDEDYLPYYNLKYVLVDEAGQLRVAHFEFMPPSILD